jgi:lipopolysaccharide export system permease protein
MKIYSHYILKKTLIAFAGLISVFVTLIWFSRAIVFVKYVTENGIKLSQFLYLFVLVLPWLLLFIIPISLLVAILLVYSQLSSDNEITILKNSGLTKLQICKPIAPLAIFSTLICFAISFFFMPYANKQLRLSKLDFRNNYSSLSFNPQTFETLNNLTIYAKNRDENNRLSGILLHDERSDQYSITITAKSGKIVSEANSALLYMENGSIQKLNYNNDKTEILNFDSYVFNLTETQKGDDSMRWKPKERYLHELLNPNDDSEESDLQKYRVEIHERFTYPLLPLVFALLGLSCILKGEFRRQGNAPNIILATILASAFLGLVILIYGLVQSSPKFTPLLYLNFILFSALSLRLLTNNYKKK